MRDSLLNDAIQVLVAAEPRGATRRLLTLISGFTGAEAIAAFEVRNGRLVLFGSHDLAQATIDAAEKAFTSSRSALEAGRAVQVDRHTVVPLMDGQQWVGVLCLQAAREGAAEDVALSLGRVLATTITAARTADQADPAARLRGLLDEHEWNVARVARILGVTRVTIYERMRRFGIPRKKVPRGIA